MTNKEKEQLEGWLIDYNYRKYESHWDHAAFQYSKSKKDEDDNLLWMISFKFYDFRAFPTAYQDWGVEIEIHIGHGITNLLISYPRNLDDVEIIASEFYEFSKKWDLNNKYDGE